MDFLILVLRNNYKGSISIAPHIIYLEKLACIFTFIRKELVEGFADQSCAISDMIIFIIQVLHMDRNDYYGGESTSLNLFQVCSRNALVAGFFFSFLWLLCFTFLFVVSSFLWYKLQLWKKFKNSDKPPAHLGSSRDYNVDMVPKVELLKNLLYSLSGYSLLLYAFHFDVMTNNHFVPVYDGEWNSCPCPYSYKCYEVPLLQSCWWRLCVQ